MAKSKSQKPILKKKGKVNRLGYIKPAPICPTDIENEKRINEFFHNFPRQVIETRAHYQCPACGVDMNIAGWYDKGEGSTGVKIVVTQFDCHSCDKRVTPKLKESNDVKS